MKRNILITGASSGIGKMIAEHLSKKGHNVVGTSRNIESASSFEMIQLDVNNEKSVEFAIKAFIDQYGEIDVVINNAGFGLCGAIEDTSMEEVKDQFETNYFGVVRVIQAVLPHMRQRKEGIIINISSIGGLIGLPFQGFYSSSKFALEGFMEALRLEVKSFNIKAFNINPGDFKTGFTSSRRKTRKISDVYKKSFETTLAIYEHDEQNAPEPEQVAVLISKLIEQGGNYQVRYLVGQFSQKMGVTIKKLIGGKLFEKILASTYKI